MKEPLTVRGEHPTAPLAAQLHPLWVAVANLQNLALPGRRYYPNQDAYSEAEYRRKVAWVGQQIHRLGADVLLCPEVWDEAALREAVAASKLRYSTVAVPGAESGAEGTPRLGLVTRWQVERLQTLTDFDPADHVPVPELGLQTRFERPVLMAELRGPHGQAFTLLGVHLKSKRPKFLLDANGHALEDRDDPSIQARAVLRSLLMRAAEAAALRRFVVTLARGRRQPLMVVGDFNDGPLSVTSQLVAATQAVAYNREARDIALFHAADLQTEPGLRHDRPYSHVYQGWPELLDQVWVSEEFDPRSRFAVGEVRRVEVFNDHLLEGRDGTRSDHGFLRVLLQMQGR
jgi:endonuclease/exonuclease/phosphatase family metal-dependent hydrolase